MSLKRLNVLSYSVAPLPPILKPLFFHEYICNDSHWHDCQWESTFISPQSEYHHTRQKNENAVCLFWCPLLKWFPCASVARYHDAVVSRVNSAVLDHSFFSHTHNAPCRFSQLSDSGPLWWSSLSRSLCLPACPPSVSTHPTPTCAPSWWTFNPPSPGWPTALSVPLTTSNFRKSSAQLPRKVGSMYGMGGGAAVVYLIYLLNKLGFFPVMILPE